MCNAKCYSTRGADYKALSYCMTSTAPDTRTAVLCTITGPPKTACHVCNKLS